MSVDVLPSCSFDGDRGFELTTSTNPKFCAQQQRRRSQKSKYEATFVQNTVALAVICRLHKWCCQLFWLTIVYVIGATGGDATLSSSRHKTLRDVRRNIVNSTQRRCKSVTDIEMQLLRHLTCPQSAIHRPLRPPHKKRMLSRPPSPNLFDIFEADESLG